MYLNVCHNHKVGLWCNETELSQSYHDTKEEEEIHLALSRTMISKLSSPHSIMNNTQLHPVHNAFHTMTYFIIRISIPVSTTIVYPSTNTPYTSLETTSYINPQTLHTKATKHQLHE